MGLNILSIYVNAIVKKYNDDSLIIKDYLEPKLTILDNYIAMINFNDKYKHFFTNNNIFKLKQISTNKNINITCRIPYYEEDDYVFVNALCVNIIPLKISIVAKYGLNEIISTCDKKKVSIAALTYVIEPKYCKIPYVSTSIKINTENMLSINL